MKKKPTSIRIQIPEPCSQSFEEMHPLPGGRYCDRCEKTVVDFTNLSDGEIVRIYQKRQGRVCGVFRNDQLNRSMPLPMTFEKRNNWKAVAAFASALLFGNMAAGQSETANSKLTKEEMFMLGMKFQPLSDLQTIKGKVLGQNGEPLIGANILIEPGKGTVSDIDGTFNLEISQNITSQKLTISYTGFETQEILWEKDKYNNEGLEIVMNEGTILLQQVVVTGLGDIKNMYSVAGGPTSVYEDEEKSELENPEKTGKKMEAPEVSILEVFPNPFVSYINVKIELEKPEAILFHLYNEAGQLLFAETRELVAGTQYVPLDVNKNGLPEGLYFLRISDSIGEIRTKRVVKMQP